LIGAISNILYTLVWRSARAAQGGEGTAPRAACQGGRDSSRTAPRIGSAGSSELHFGQVPRAASLGDGAAEREGFELLGLSHHGSELCHDGGAAVEGVALLGAGLIAHLDAAALDGQGGDGARLLGGEGGAQSGGGDGEAGHGCSRLVGLIVPWGRGGGQPTP